jgi:prepilin-type N-terminal cleavage/methylation domain-containing protein
MKHRITKSTFRASHSALRPVVERFALTTGLRGKSGFTIVEFMVAIGLFSVIVSIAVGGLANAIRTQRQIAALIAANSNVSFALEQMARDIRTGSAFTTTGSGSELDFTDPYGQSVAYRLNAGKVEKNAGDGNFQAITGDNAVVQYLNFTLLGNLPGDGYPPRITIIIGISPPANIAGVNQTVSRIQTTVSARQLDT